MKCFSELNGTTVPVHIYTADDSFFKKKSVRTVDLLFRLHGVVSPIFAHINLYHGGFKLCLTDPSDDNAAQIEFERQINQLNGMLVLLAEKSFVESVIKQCDSVLQAIDTNVRGDKGELRPAYEVKSLFSEALVEYLNARGIEARCNIGRGTLYVGEDVIINSGITSNSSISGGIIDFLGFKFSATSQLQYVNEYHKAPKGFYTPGSWTNKLGDKPFELGLSVLVLDALESFITRTASLIGLSLDNDDFIAQSLKAASDRKIALQDELNCLLELAEFDPKTVLSSNIVQNHQLYIELTELDLGEAAKLLFAQKDAPRILLSHLAGTIGAAKAEIIHPSDKAEEEHRNSDFDEHGKPHVALPNVKTRRGLLSFKNELNDANSLASFLFEARRMRINVASTAYYDQQGEILKEEWELVDVCFGAKFPLVKRGEIVRFWFKL